MAPGPLNRTGIAAAVALAVALAAVLFAALGPWDAGLREPPGPGPTPTPSANYLTAPGPLRAVDDTPGGARFPGGIIRLGERNGGRWLIVYQRFDGRIAEVFAREATDLLGPPGPEVMVSRRADGSAFDPAAAELPDGRVVVTWTTGQSIWIAERLGPGAYGTPRPFFADTGGANSEQTLASFGDVQAIFYDFHPFSRPEFVWDARMRRVAPGPASVEAGRPVTVVREGPGYGTEGVQRRVTAARTGDADGVLAVWSQHSTDPCVIPSGSPGEPAGCGPRSVYGSVSPDLGASWMSAMPVAEVPGHDLVNPFVVEVSPGDLRVYFTVDRNVPDVGFVRSMDHGRTWSPVQFVLIPNGVSPARMVFQVDPKNGLVALLTERGFGRLVTLLVDPLRDQSSP